MYTFDVTGLARKEVGCSCDVEDFVSVMKSFPTLINSLSGQVTPYWIITT